MRNLPTKQHIKPHIYCVFHLLTTVLVSVWQKQSVQEMYTFLSLIFGHTSPQKTRQSLFVSNIKS